MNLKLLLIIMGMVVITGCYYDKEIQLYGNCNSANVTYSTTIKGILTRYSCLNCHSGPAPSGNVNLDSYDKLKIKVEDGRLIGAINHNNGYAAMPKDLPKMTQCDINKIQAWINAGAPEN